MGQLWAQLASHCQLRVQEQRLQYVVIHTKANMDNIT